MSDDTTPLPLDRPPVLTTPRGELVGLSEAWGDFVDPAEALRDHPSFTISNEILSTTISDRADGDYWPVYRCEQDLARIRGIARNLSMIDGVAIGAVEALNHYVVGSGPVIEFTCSKQHEGLRQEIDRAVESVLLQNEFVGGLDREIHRRSREDGETFVRIRRDEDSGTVDLELIEPDQIREPANVGEVEDYIGVDYSSSWKYGIHTPHLQPYKTRGFVVSYYASGGHGEPTANEWDYVANSEMVQWKRNVSRSAKRGVSDFDAIHKELRTAARLGQNMGIGAAAQAAIAWIEELPPGTSQADAKGMIANEAKASRTNANGTTNYFRKYNGGSVITTSPGRKYVAGPMGSERNGGFEVAVQVLLRRIGVRWTMPEYIISGDASNSNFASTLVAESPFVKARQADQAWYIAGLRRLIWGVVQALCEMGVISAAYEELRKQIDLSITLPEVASRDPVALATLQRSQLDMGILSRKTAAAQADLDYDEEVRNGASVPGASGQLDTAQAGSTSPPATTLPSTSVPAFESVRDAVRSIVSESWRNYP